MLTTTIRADKDIAAAVIYDRDCVTDGQSHGVAVLVCEGLRRQYQPTFLLVAATVPREIDDKTNAAVTLRANLESVSGSVNISNKLRGEEIRTCANTDRKNRRVIVCREPNGFNCGCAALRARGYLHSSIFKLVGIVPPYAVKAVS